MSRRFILAPLDYLKRLTGSRFEGLSAGGTAPRLLDKSQLQEADVLFCRGGEKNIPWQIISYGSSGSYVHVAIYMGKGEVAESTTKGVIQSSLANLIDRYKYIAVTRYPGIADNQIAQAAVVDHCRIHVNKKTKYDFLGAALSPIYELLDLAYLQLKNRPIDFNWPRRKNRTFCSQFALDAFVPGGYVKENFYAIGARSPTALAEGAYFELIGFLSREPNLLPMLEDDILWTGGG